MNATRPRAIPLLALAVALVAIGCAKNKLHLIAPTKIPPEVRLTSAPIDTTEHNFYSITLDWVGYDPDGRVDHYLYAIDAPEGAGAETSWVSTTDHERRLVFSARSKVPSADSLTQARDFHTFVIAAVDNDGLTGPRVHREFFAYTVAPTVDILVPKPNKLIEPVLPPSVRFSWSGNDPDGVFTNRPVRYKYILLGPNTPGGIQDLVDHPEKIRARYAPDFPDSLGWIQTAADTTFAQFTNLSPDARYLFMVVAFDEAGAYSPVFSPSSNMLVFKIGFAGTLGPQFTLFNEFFEYQYPTGGFSVRPENWINLEIPAGKVTFNWFAVPPQGADIRSYRWMLDGDVFDETPRSDEIKDTKHWSAKLANVTSATVGPFGGGENHLFYVEAEDNTDLVSIAIVNFATVQSTLDRTLLIVNDTRFQGEGKDALGHYKLPGGSWPNYAELDTFLVARGGYPWIEYSSDIPVPRSTPGLFNGYDWDTIGTRVGRLDLSLSLRTIGAFKHVIWLTDLAGATNDRDGTNPTAPMTSLRYMSSRGRLNTLGAYVKQGGLAWVAGGGSAFATLIPFNVGSNDQRGGRTIFSSSGSQRELSPGRFMYDLAKWQSEITVQSAGQVYISRYLGRYRGHTELSDSLPRVLERKQQGFDTPPPHRDASSGFYTDTQALEFISQDNFIFEATLTDPADFYIDSFDDPDASTLKARWVSSDSLNTVVGRDPAGFKGGAMKVTTQGGGASVGDTVQRDLGSPRDWLGLATLTFAIKQDQPTSAVQWRVRIREDDATGPGGSMSAVVPVTITANDVNKWKNVVIPLNQFVMDPGTVPNLGRVRYVQFQCVTGTAAGTTGFDELAIAATLDDPVLDTLFIAKSQSTGDTTRQFPVMTYYHGHDSAPLVFSGFSLWSYHRPELQDLVDFVLQDLWGLRKTTGTGPRPGSAALHRARLTAIAGVPAAPRRLPGAADVRRAWRMPFSRK